MISLKVKTGFSQLSDDELTAHTKCVIAGITDNDLYLAPIPSPQALKQAFETYTQAKVASANGNIHKKSIKNQRRNSLIVILNSLASYVEEHCEDNFEKLRSSGFQIQENFSEGDILEIPENFTVDFGPVPASLRLATDKVQGAVGYRWEYTLHPATAFSIWSVIVTPARRILVNGLESQKQYDLRVAGVGKTSFFVYSKVISKYAE